MLYKKILVPFDGSEPARHALEVAKNLVADDPEATLYLLNVLPAGTLASHFDSADSTQGSTPMLLADPNAYQSVIKSETDLALSKLAEGADDALAGVSCCVVKNVAIGGSVPDGIVDYSCDHGCEIIVMGRRGLGGLRGMLGSVSYSVLHSADIPVLTVK